MRSAGPPTAILPACGEPHDGGRRRAAQRRGLAERVVEVGDAHRLPPRVQHVAVAVGVERVAGVVARHRDAHARVPEFPQRRDAAPARGAAGRAVLEVHVHRRQAHDRDAGVAQQRGLLAERRLVLQRQRTAMAAGDAPLVAVPHRGPRHGGQRRRGRVARFVDVEVDVEAALAGEGEQPVEQVVEVGELLLVQARRGAGDAAHQAAALRHEVGQLRAEGRAVDVERHQRHGLQRDPPRIGVAHLAEHGPAVGRLALVGIEVGPDRRDAVRLGAAQGEVHAAPEVRPAPVRLAVRPGRVDRAAEVTREVGRAVDGVSLVEVGVHVDERRPQVAAAEVDVARARRTLRGGPDRRDAAARERDVDEGGAVAVDGGAVRHDREEGYRHAGAPQRRGAAEGGEVRGGNQGGVLRAANRAATEPRRRIAVERGKASVPWPRRQRAVTRRRTAGPARRRDGPPPR